MKKISSLLLVLILGFGCSKHQSTTDSGSTKKELSTTEKVEKAPENTVVGKYGQLKISGGSVVSEANEKVQLRGMSLFWSQWMGKYYTKGTVNWLQKDWNCTVIRAAMGVEKGGYLTNPEQEQAKVETVVNACIDAGVYVIIDYHAHEAHNDVEAAKKFFGAMARKFGKYPNVIYETYNEPLQDVEWNAVLKPYHEEVVAAIRAHDPDNIILCGTRMWSQRVDEVIGQRLEDDNVAYVLHYYAYSHRRPLRAIAQKAIDAGIPLFVSEQGNCHASGGGNFDKEQGDIWYKFLDDHKIGWCNWSVADKVETASVLKPGASSEGGWSEDQLTESGKYVRNEIKSKNDTFD